MPAPGATDAKGAKSSKKKQQKSIHQLNKQFRLTDLVLQVYADKKHNRRHTTALYQNNPQYSQAAAEGQAAGTAPGQVMTKGTN